MTATPAQVANDLAAQARWFEKRNPGVASACRDGARLIRHMLAGEPVDGRTFHGIKGRMERLEQHYAKLLPIDLLPLKNNPSHSLWRGLRQIEELRRAQAGVTQ